MISSLYLLQFSCFIFSIIMALLLCTSRLQQNHSNRRYETARWMQVGAMMLLAIHYFLQMRFSIRATHPDWGVMVNILFYAPAAYLLSSSMLAHDINREGYIRYLIIGGIGCLSIPIVFGIGLIQYQGDPVPIAQSLMHFLFVVLMLYYIAVPVFSIRRSMRRVVNETGGEIFAYIKYAQASYLILCTTSVFLLFAIVWTPMLYVVGPLVLLSIFLYIQSFVAFGYNLESVEEVLNENGKAFEAEATLTEMPSASDVQQTEAKAATEATEIPHPLPSTRTEEISQAIVQWCEAGGFRERETNMVTLARYIKASRMELTAYFEFSLHTTFRIWLSDIRLKEAQKLMQEHPEYGNDKISIGCGFSSRSQLYRIFSDKLGMTPGEWRERQKASATGEQ